MSKYIPEAFVSIEDKRFYKHHGVDWIRTIGVFIKNNDQGGSTITQQLIKNLTDDNKVTYVRKFNEILKALNLERNFSKKQNLRLILIQFIFQTVAMVLKLRQKPILAKKYRI